MDMRARHPYEYAVVDRVDATAAEIRTHNKTDMRPLARYEIN